MGRTAVYAFRPRLGTDTDAQLDFLERLIARAGDAAELYCDYERANQLSRPAYGRLLVDLRAGLYVRLVVWNLDALGLEIGGLAELLGELAALGVEFVSSADAMQTGPEVLRSLQQWLNAVAFMQRRFRSRSVSVGCVRAKARGQKWWPSRKGKLQYLQPATVELVVKLWDNGRPVAAIAEATGVTRPTVYRLLRLHGRKLRRR